VSAINYSFIILTETWLTENFLTCELGLYNYNVYRYDRCNLTSACTRGGGVLIGVRKDICSNSISISNLNVEQIFVRFNISSISFVIGGVYIPPHSNLDIYNSHSQTIEFLVRQYPFHSFIICGDYNLPEIVWDNDNSGLTYLYSSNICATCIPETFASNGFFQNNSIFNSHDSILDLVFCNTSFLVEKSLEPLVPIDSYHPPLNIVLPYSDSKPLFENRHTFYNFRKTNYSNISSFIKGFDWNSTLASLDLETAYNTLFDALHLSILKFVPKCQFWNSTYPPWFNRELKDILLLKKKAHIEYKANSNFSNYNKFSLLRARFKFMSKKCLTEYNKRIETSLAKHPCDFWKYVKKNRTGNGMPKEITYNGTIYSNKQEVANMFAEMFSSAYSTGNTNIDNNLPNIPNFDLPSNVYFSLDDVFNGLSALKGNWSVGPDGISGEFLFQIKSIISYPLFTLFRRSLDEGTFPSILKLSSVTPIPKSGSLSRASNYRPISIQSHISKLFESLILKYIQPTVNGILMEEQYGFRPGRSTLSCNLVFTSFIYDAFKNHSQVDVIYTDFKKAFDSVNHEILIRVLSASGFGEPLISWFSSYLCDRYFVVKVFDVNSNVFLSPSGVPQGGHLSPLLFSLFVNSASIVLNSCKLLCFADDMKLFMQINSLDDCHKLQIDLNNFFEWSQSLGLTLNFDKCYVMSFAKKRSAITWSYELFHSEILRVDTVVDLGFKFNSSLDPEPHINMICCKAYKILGFIKRLAYDFKLSLSLKMLFCSLVRPTLEYGAVLWDPHTSGNSQKLEMVQRKFLNFAGFILHIRHPPHDYTPISDVLSMETLASRRYSLGVKFLNGLLSGKVHCPYLLSLINFRVPKQSTRSTIPFYVPPCTSNYLANEPMRRLMSLANVDPSHLC
jgi:hypothetical protein